MASEPTLIDRTLGGDREAFADLIEGYLGLVHGIILNKVRRPDEVEDLVQDVFVKAFQELSNLRDRGKFGPWLGRIALNRAQAWLRQRQSHRTTVTDDPKLLEKVSLERADDLLETAEKDGILWEALDRLRPEYRQILLLFHFEDCPQQDIARFLGISVPTVKWRLMRARTVLRRRVEDVVRGPTEAGRQRQKERIAAALPILAVVTRETALPTSVALFAVVRRGLAFGGALTLGLAGSLIYESQVLQAEAEAPAKAPYGRVSLYLAVRSVRRRFVPVCVDRLGRSRHGATSGRHRPAAALFVAGGSAAAELRLRVGEVGYQETGTVDDAIHVADFETVGVVSGVTDQRRSRRRGGSLRQRCITGVGGEHRRLHSEPEFSCQFRHVIHDSGVIHAGAILAGQDGVATVHRLVLRGHRHHVEGDYRRRRYLTYRPYGPEAADLLF